MNEEPSVDAAKRQIEEGLRRDLFENSKQAATDILEKWKAEHGTEGIDVTAIRSALFIMVTFLNNNKRFVPEPETDFLLNLGLQVVADAVAAAKAGIEERRIVMLR